MYSSPNRPGNELKRTIRLYSVTDDAFLSHSGLNPLCLPGGRSNAKPSTLNPTSALSVAP